MIANQTFSGVIVLVNFNVYKDWLESSETDPQEKIAEIFGSKQRSNQYNPLAHILFWCPHVNSNSQYLLLLMCN